MYWQHVLGTRHKFCCTFLFLAIHDCRLGKKKARIKKISLRYNKENYNTSLIGKDLSLKCLDSAEKGYFFVYFLRNLFKCVFEDSLYILARFNKEWLIKTLINIFSNSYLFIFVMIFKFNKNLLFMNNLFFVTLILYFSVRNTIEIVNICAHYNSGNVHKIIQNRNCLHVLNSVTGVHY